jgi:hypothetical protein
VIFLCGTPAHTRSCLKLEGGDSPDPETAIFHLHASCVLQELIAEGYFERIGHDKFVRTS